MSESAENWEQISFAKSDEPLQKRRANTCRGEGEILAEE